MSIIHQNHWRILDLQRCCSSSLVILLSHCYHDPIIVTRILSWSWSGAVHLHSTPRRLPRRQNRQLSSSPLFSHRGRWWQRMLLMVWCDGSKKSKFSKNIKVDKPTKGGLVSLLLLAIPTGRDISMYPEKVIFDFQFQPFGIWHKRFHHFLFLVPRKGHLSAHWFSRLSIIGFKLA